MRKFASTTLLRSLALCVIFWSIIDVSWSDDARPIPLLRASKLKSIQSLAVDPTLTIENKIAGDTVITYVRVKGKFTGPFASLISGTVRANPTESGDFDLPIMITGPSTGFELTAIDPYGVTSKEHYQIDFPNWANYTSKLQSTRKNELDGIPNPLSISLGLSNIFYTETNVADYNSTVITGKINYIRASPFPRWNIGFGSFLTVMPLQESASASARFWGVNARLGYSLLPNSKVWKAGIYMGVYYTTMFVKDDQFGFNGMTGPQIFPVVKKLFNGGRSASVYLKYAALVSNTSVISFSSRELAIGGEYVYLYNGGRSHGIQFDASSLNVVFPLQTVSVKTLSISLSYHL